MKLYAKNEGHMLFASSTESSSIAAEVVLSTDAVMHELAEANSHLPGAWSATDTAHFDEQCQKHDAAVALLIKIPAVNILECQAKALALESCIAVGTGPVEDNNEGILRQSLTRDILNLPNGEA